MQPDVIELARRLANLVRLGTVAEVDAAHARIRVQSGALLTPWLPWLPTRAGSTLTWSLPSIGEQVVLLSPSGDTAQAIALPAVYSDTHPAPSSSPTEHTIVFPDGAHITYDTAAGHLDATAIAHVTVNAAGGITLHAPIVTLDAAQTLATGALTVQGLLTYQAGLAGTGGGSGTTITGDITQTGGQLSSNGIVLDSHTHGGVQTGGGSTGGPQ